MIAASSSVGDASAKSSEQVSAAVLRKWAPFIRKDLIEAGDVVLSRGRGLESGVIAGMTGGRYSHAAIFLPFRLKDDILPRKLDEPKGTGPVDFEAAIRKYGGIHVKGGVHLDLVEADDYGVGAVPPRYLSITFGGRRYPVIRLSGEPAPKEAILLRHPDIKSVDERTLEEAVKTFSDAELLRRYSSMDRLVGPLTLPAPIKRVLGRFVLWCYPQPKRLILPGCFCSELVAKFFQRLNIPLFADSAAPENISPNHLVPSRSQFKAVPDAIVTAADIPDDAQGEVIGILQLDLRAPPPGGAKKDEARGWSYPLGRLKNFLLSLIGRGTEKKRSYLLSLIEVREDKELLFPEIEKVIEDTAASAKKVEDIIRKRQLSDFLMHDAGGAVVQGQILDVLGNEVVAPTLRRRLEDLLVTTIFLKFLRDHLRSANVPAEAGAVLRLNHDRAVAELFYSHNRTRALVRMSRARRLSAENSRQERMNALADWRSEKTRWGQEIATLDRPIRRRFIPNGPSDADTDASVTKVLDEVAAKVMTALRIP